MPNEYTITSGQWKKISNPGQVIVAWMKAVGSDGSSIIKISHTVEAQTPEDDIPWGSTSDLDRSIALKLKEDGQPSPVLSPSNELDVYYATLLDSNETAKIIVDTSMGFQRIIDTKWTDQISPPLDLYFIQAVNSPTTLAAKPAIDDTQITVVDDSVLSVGDYLLVVSGTSLEGRFYFGEILSLPGANVVNLDTPFDFSYDIGDQALPTTRDLNVNGSITPQVFEIRGAGAGSPIAVDITRLLAKCLADTAVDMSKFGDIVGGLTKGIVLRRNNGAINNIFNVKTNGELANIAYDWNPLTASNPAQGQDGFLWRYSFAGPDKHGTAIRLRPGESLELTIQDDLSSLDSLRIIGAGHIVD
ncbi:hypothetical protein KAR91_13235 [Candidatus Pacearchaeota archaeon]|nr:hypothetical protein [Candidatus Pacearchaeota archaeon]